MCPLCLMRDVHHSLVHLDLVALVDHVVEITSGDFAVAVRCLEQINKVMTAIQVNPPPQTHQQDRDLVQATEGLAQHRNPLCPQPERVSIYRRSSRNHHVPAIKRKRVLTLVFVKVRSSKGNLLGPDPGEGLTSKEAINKAVAG